MTGDLCGYALTDAETDEMYPCDRPATGWRWYQDVGEHQDLLDAACDWHANEGGQRIHDAEVFAGKVRALADELGGYGHGRYNVHLEERLPCPACDLLADLRALLEAVR